MPTFNTDWIPYSSVYTPPTNLSTAQIDAINTLSTQIGGIGNETSLALRYTTSNLGIL